MKGKRYMISAKGAAIVLTFSITASSLFGFAGGMAAAEYRNSSEPPAAAQLSLKTAANSPAVLGTTSASTGSGSELSAADIAGLAANSVVEITTETVTTDSWMQQ